MADTSNNTPTVTTSTQKSSSTTVPVKQFAGKEGALKSAANGYVTNDTANTFFRGDGLLVMNNTAKQERSKVIEEGFSYRQQLLAKAGVQHTTGHEKEVADRKEKAANRRKRSNTVHPALPAVKTADKNPGVKSVPVKQKHTDAIVQGKKTDGAKDLHETAEVDSKLKKSPTKPADDPAFMAIVAQVKTTGEHQHQHPDPHTRVAQSQHASHIDPALEKGSQAGQLQVEKMGAQPTKKFDAATFKASLLKNINDKLPKSEDDAKQFKGSNRLNEVKTNMQQQVGDEKKASSGSLETATKEAPPTGSIHVTTPVAMTEEVAGKKPVIQKTEQAAPKAKAEGEISLKKESQDPDKLMQESKVTDDQLAASNEPSFNNALDSKNHAKEEAEHAPAEYRLAEGPVLNQAKTGAGGMVLGAMNAFTGLRGGAFTGVGARKSKTKAADEQVRQKVATQMQAIYDGTKKTVEKILSDLDKDVNATFDTGIKNANEAFEANVSKRLDDYYGWFTLDDAISEYFNGLPKEIDDIFQDEKRKFTAAMEPVIDNVAKKVETGLNAATDEIAKGKKQLDDYWKSQPVETRKVAADAYKEISGKYSELEKQVDEKQSSLLTGLTDKYTAAVGQLQEKFDKIKSDKMGLLGKALAFVGGVIKTIMQLKDMLLNTLSRVANVIGDIIAHPIDFLGNLVEAVGMGFKNFAGNILEHLKTGFFDWLMGAMPPGIKFPDTWDLKGIFTFVAQLFGLTWAAIKAKVTKVVGQPVMNALETMFDIFVVIQRDGLAGLWEYIKEKIGDLKTMVIDALMNMLQTQIVQAGISWLLGLLTPAGAFIKACQAIYKIIMWFVNNAQRIMQLVNTIIDSCADIVAHRLDGAAKKVETTMVKIIPIAIGFLAGLLGIGDLSEKVQNIINKIKAPVDKAIDWVVDKAVTLGKKLIGKLTGKDKPVENSPEKQAKIDAGLADLHKEEDAQAVDGNLAKEQADNIAKSIKQKHSVFTSMTVVDGGGKWEYEYTASPKQKEPSKEGKAGKKELSKIDYSTPFKVTANPLTSNRPQGTAPGNIDGWDHAQLLNKVADIWVKGHMLSEALGGQGTPSNLTIIDKTTNSKMSAGPEQKAKDETANGKTLSYVTTWENHSSQGPAKHFAKKVTVIVKEITKTATKVLASQSYNSALPSENIDDVKINLNAIGRPTIMLQFGVSESFAKDLLRARETFGNFKTSFDVRIKVTKLYKQEQVSEDSNKWGNLTDSVNIITGKLQSNNLEIK